MVSGISDAPEHQVYSQGGTQLFFRSSRQKPSPDHVTLAQWVGANAHILQELICKGTIQSVDDVDTYLQYNIIFSDYAQVNELLVGNSTRSPGHGTRTTSTWQISTFARRSILHATRRPSVSRGIPPRHVMPKGWKFVETLMVQVVTVQCVGMLTPA